MRIAAQPIFMENLSWLCRKEDGFNKSRAMLNISKDSNLIFRLVFQFSASFQFLYNLKPYII